MLPLPSRHADDARYHSLPVERGRHEFLSGIFNALDVDRLELWTEAVGTPTLTRGRTDGLVTATARCDGRDLAIAWSDFRVNGGFYGRANSERFQAFLRTLADLPSRVPLLYVVNSGGVSMMEGRTTFSAAFGIWPELLRYADTAPVLTCAVGKCLGLAPLLFGLGQYRVAVADRTRVNLTGPEVLRLFFGRDCAFEERASAERCVEQHDLVHEIVPDVAAAIHLFRTLLAPGAPLPPAQPATLPPRTAALLHAFLDAPPRELVPGWCPRLRLFLGTHGGSPLGVFINPPDRSDNLIDVRTLDKYAAGLDVFRALGVPIISLLDSPGIDPRFEQADANHIRRIVAVGEKIIRYPHGAMGVVAGRCFGGATTLAFPKIFGGVRVVALRGAQMGMMDDRIVGRLLGSSARLRAQWQASVATRSAEFRDLLADGSLDAVVEPEGLGAEVAAFLHSLRRRPGPDGLHLMREAV